MKLALTALLGFLLALAALTLFGPSGFTPLAILYSVLLYWLFFGQLASALALLTGGTIGVEMLTNGRFGLATILAVFLYGLSQLFAQHLRFTSLYVRYIVALVLGNALYAVLLYPLPAYPHRLLLLFLLLLLLIPGSFLLQRRNQASDYELL